LKSNISFVCVYLK